MAHIVIVSSSAQQQKTSVSLEQALENSIRTIENRTMNEPSSEMTEIFKKSIYDAIVYVTVKTDNKASESSLTEFKGKYKSLQEFKEDSSIREKIKSLYGSSENLIDEKVMKIADKSLTYIFTNVFMESCKNTDSAYDTNSKYSFEFYGVNAEDGYIHVKITKDTPSLVKRSDGTIPNIHSEITKAIIIVNRHNI